MVYSVRLWENDARSESTKESGVLHRYSEYRRLLPNYSRFVAIQTLAQVAVNPFLFGGQWFPRLFLEDVTLRLTYWWGHCIGELG